MGKTNRDRVKNLKDAVLSGVYTEEYFDDADLGG